MDAISIKLIDRNFLQKEKENFTQIIKNIELQNIELNNKFEISVINTHNYKQLWQLTERQKDKLFTSLENQKLITKNIKKKRLKMGFYILEEAFRLDLSPLLC